MNNEVLIPGIAEFEKSPMHDAPGITDTYHESLKQLVLFQENGVTHFYGCPLDLDKKKNVWMSPVEVDDGTSYSYFQILYVNTDPLEALNDQTIPVSLLEVDEASYKLTPTEHPGYEQLMSQFGDKRKHILIRPCNTGMAYYPRPVLPSPDKSTTAEHLERLILATGLREPEISVQLSKPSEHDQDAIKSGTLEITHLRKYAYEGGKVHSYGLVLDDDPWKYYEILTPRRLEKMSAKNMLVRIDSGCDIGQIYDDHGCDCREQLHTALEDIQNVENGLIIHIPSQDGRGFGAATKMETEGLKRGIELVTNRGKIEPVDTITAAKMVLGEDFDIRTYKGAGKVLEIMGIESVVLQTDNRLKIDGLAQGGIKVERKATNTSGANGSHRHVKAKHRHSKIYFGRKGKKS